MIKNDAHSKASREAARNLQQVLLAARKVHRAAEYRAMSEPILLEIQQRQQEIAVEVRSADNNPSVP
jgi:hypothetical protein